MDWLVGDVQGCDGALERLLQVIGFSPSRDHLVLLGDLVNRGPASLAVVRRVQALQGSASAVLGNHDLHLLALAFGERQPKRNDTLQELLTPAARASWLAWLRAQPLALVRGAWLCVHAGLLPQWTAARALELSTELSAVLQGAQAPELLRGMYGNGPAHWDDALQGATRWRVALNGFTRLRFCSAEGEMEFETKESAHDAPAGFMPWFEVPGRASAGQAIAFGHWSTLGALVRPRLLGLDSGCVWGGGLSAARIDGGHLELVQVPCEQAQAPGKA
jgi:bis(5'-nucleosyl)-tetraphosphatase (symmetrical)